MKGKTSIITAVLLLCSSFTLFAEAPSFGGDLTVESKYMYRGVSYSEGAVFQPDVWVSWGDLSVTVWASLDLTDDKERRGDIHEVDLSIDYARDFEKLLFGLGYVYFTYPDAPGQQNAEGYMFLSSNFEIFNISATANYDIYYSSLYFNPEISVGYTFADMITPSLSASLGIVGENYKKAYYGLTADGGLNDLSTSLAVAVALPGAIGEYLSLSGHISYATLLDDDITDVIESKERDGEKDNFWAGLTLSLGF